MNSIKNSRLIKKYPNRRLYDTTQSRYITLEEIKDMVLQSIDFKVIDAKTADDMTNNVLLQIINEQEQQGTPLFSKQILQNLIRFYGNSLQNVMSRYLETSLDLFIEQQKQLQNPMEEILRTQPSLQIVSELAKHNLELWQKITKSYISPKKPHTKKTPDSSKHKDKK